MAKPGSPRLAIRAAARGELIALAPTDYILPFEHDKPPLARFNTANPPVAGARALESLRSARAQ